MSFDKINKVHFANDSLTPWKHPITSQEEGSDGLLEVKGLSEPAGMFEPAIFYLFSGIYLI